MCISCRPPAPNPNGSRGTPRMTKCFGRPTASAFSSPSARGPMAWDSPIYTVGIEGDLSSAIAMGSGAAGRYSQEARCSRSTARAIPTPSAINKGSNNRDVWVMNVRRNTFTQLTDLKLEEYKDAVHDANPMFRRGRHDLLRVGARRIFNIWKIAARGGNATQVTKPPRGGVRFPSISPDGRTITYSNEFDLWVLPIAGSRSAFRSTGLHHRPALVDVESTEKPPTALARRPTALHGGRLPRRDLHRADGHGRRRKTPRSRRIACASARDVLPGRRYLPYISDESKEEEIWIVDLRTNEKKKLTTQA